MKGGWGMLGLDRLMELWKEKCECIKFWMVGGREVAVVGSFFGFVCGCVVE